MGNNKLHTCKQVSLEENPSGGHLTSMNVLKAGFWATSSMSSSIWKLAIGYLGISSPRHRLCRNDTPFPWVLSLYLVQGINEAPVVCMEFNIIMKYVAQELFQTISGDDGRFSVAKRTVYIYQRMSWVSVDK